MAANKIEIGLIKDFFDRPLGWVWYIRVGLDEYMSDIGKPFPTAKSAIESEYLNRVIDGLELRSSVEDGSLRIEIIDDASICVGDKHD